MADFRQMIRADIDPSKPVPEICAVIYNVVLFNPDDKQAILKGVIEACQGQLQHLKKGVKQDASELPTTNRNKPDK